MSAAGAGVWLDLAREDVRAARRLLEPTPQTEIAAYHTQQAAEKALKARLVQFAIAYPRGRGEGHDIGVIARCLPQGDPTEDLAAELAVVTP